VTVQTLLPPPPAPANRDDVRAMLEWLRERGIFASRDNRLSIGGALKAEYGDGGRTLWKDDPAEWDMLSPVGSLVEWVNQAAEWGYRGTVRPYTGRNALGQFTVGNAGRPKGARNRVTRETETLLAALVPDAIKMVSEHARDDPRIALWVLQNFVKPGRYIELPDMPPVQSADDVPAALQAIVESVGSGEMALEDGALIVGLLGQILDVLKSVRQLRGGGGLTPTP
jgi:hypothetical protein